MSHQDKTHWADWVEWYIARVLTCVAILTAVVVVIFTFPLFLIGHIANKLGYHLVD